MLHHQCHEHFVTNYLFLLIVLRISYLFSALGALEHKHTLVVRDGVFSSLFVGEPTPTGVSVA